MKKDPDLHFALIFFPLFRAVNNMPCSGADVMLFPTCNLKGKKGLKGKNEDGFAGVCLEDLFISRRFDQHLPIGDCSGTPFASFCLS